MDGRTGNVIVETKTDWTHRHHKALMERLDNSLSSESDADEKLIMRINLALAYLNYRTNRAESRKL